MNFKLLLFAALAAVFPIAAGAAVPSAVTLDGRLLTAASGPVSDGDYALTFALYAAQDATATVWTEQVGKVAVKGGAFSHELGAAKALGQGVLAAPQGLWLAVTVGSEPELPRTPLRSVLYARRAELAEGLQCAGCVDATMLGPQVLAGYAKTQDLSGYVKVSELGDYVKASALAKVAGTGQYADLAGLPVLVKVGTACGTGLFVQGIKADGSLDCAAMTIKGGACVAGQVVTEVKADGSVVCGTVAATLPADGLAAVSNGLLTNVFDEVYASTTTPKSIPDNNPSGVLDEIVVPDSGTVKEISVSIDITGQTTGSLVVTLFDPNNVAYVLHSKADVGGALKTSWPVPTKTVSGDLTSWVGQNPKGTWRLIVADWAAGGSAGNLLSWSVKFKILSSSRLMVNGQLAATGGVKPSASGAVCETTTASTGFSLTKCDGILTAISRADTDRATWISGSLATENKVYDVATAPWKLRFDGQLMLNSQVYSDVERILYSGGQGLCWRHKDGSSKCFGALEGAASQTKYPYSWNLCSIEGISQSAIEISVVGAGSWADGRRLCARTAKGKAQCISCNYTLDSYDDAKTYKQLDVAGVSWLAIDSDGRLLCTKSGYCAPSSPIYARGIGTFTNWEGSKPCLGKSPDWGVVLVRSDGGADLVCVSDGAVPKSPLPTSSIDVASTISLSVSGRYPGRPDGDAIPYISKAGKLGYLNAMATWGPPWDAFITAWNSGSVFQGGPSWLWCDQVKCGRKLEYWDVNMNYHYSVFKL